MRRRQLLEAAAAAVVICALGPARAAMTASARVMTVKGWIAAREMGVTLTHEHLFADLRSYDEQAAAPLAIDMDEVVAVVLPYLRQIRALGCRTLIDCTATHLGRNPALVRRLSEASGLNMLTVTGAYLAADGRFIPPYVRTESMEALSDRWIGEWEHGIDGTGIRPGLIKLGVNGGPLTPLEAKVVDAAARTHLRTGLVIGTHVGPWRAVESGHNAAAARAILARLAAAGVAPDAWIWIHAQNESDFAAVTEVARTGAGVSLDGFRPDQVDRYVGMLTQLRRAGLLDRVLLSQDAGWYTAGKPRGGPDFAPYAPLLATLRPALRQAGFTTAEIDNLLVKTPARVFAVRLRRGSEAVPASG